MSLTLCHDCVMLAKSSSAYRTGYACGDFARMPCPVKDLGHFPRNLLQNPGLIQKAYMSEAIKEAKRAFAEDEVPIGAVVVVGGRIIARGHNQIERLKDPTAHAEILAVTSAANFLGTKWLNEAALYATIEPCPMCAGALVLARIKQVYFGAKDPKAGACGSVVNIANHKKLNHRIKIKGGILEQECGALLKEFFRKKRAKLN